MESDDGLGFARGCVNAILIIVLVSILIWFVYEYGFIKWTLGIGAFLLFVYVIHQVNLGIIKWRRNNDRRK